MPEIDGICYIIRRISRLGTYFATEDEGIFTKLPHPDVVPLALRVTPECQQIAFGRVLHERARAPSKVRGQALPAHASVASVRYWILLRKCCPDLVNPCSKSIGTTNIWNILEDIFQNFWPLHSAVFGFSEDRQAEDVTSVLGRGQEMGHVELTKSPEMSWGCYVRVFRSDLPGRDLCLTCFNAKCINTFLLCRFLFLRNLQGRLERIELQFFEQ